MIFRNRGQKYSTRIKDAGIAIRHSRGYIISILQGPERGWTSGEDNGSTTRLKKNNIFHPSSQAPGPGPGPAPGPGPGPCEEGWKI